MANKTQVATVGEQQAAVVINNQFIDGLTKQLEEKCKYGLSFPKDYNLSNALMGAYLVLKETKDRNNKPILESCSQISIANSLMNMATLGLSVQKKQGYFVSYAGQCQFQRSYFGNITIARRYGMKDIHAEIIYQGDKFKYHIEDGNKVLDSHEQDFMNIDNEKILGAYAVVLMEDGTKHLEVMNIKQIKQSWSQGLHLMKRVNIQISYRINIWIIGIGHYRHGQRKNVDGEKVLSLFRLPAASTAVTTTSVTVFAQFVS